MTGTRAVPSIFDLWDDDDGVCRMPFNPADYGDDNGVMRLCHKCRKLFPQSTMKELCVGPHYENAIPGKDKLYLYSIFYCKTCWFSSDISDASNWSA